MGNLARCRLTRLLLQLVCTQIPYEKSAAGAAKPLTLPPLYILGEKMRRDQTHAELA